MALPYLSNRIIRAPSLQMDPCPEGAKTNFAFSGEFCSDQNNFIAKNRSLPAKISSRC